MSEFLQPDDPTEISYALGVVSRGYLCLLQTAVKLQTKP